MFKNYGRSAGASLSHPHSQLIATPIIPIFIEEELKGAKTYYNIKKDVSFAILFSKKKKEKLELLKKMIVLYLLSLLHHVFHMKRG
nr:hypothetical protein [Marinitoga lauensis]